MEMVKHIMLLKGRFNGMRKLGEMLRNASLDKKIPLKRGDMAKGYS
ncbi:MAG TPA: hypothetical protein VIM70_04225 [Clostridium sp.]